MDNSQSYEGEDTLREIARAQKTLDEVEDKMKKFRSRKKQQQNTNLTKAPYPDLKQYFSFLTQEQKQEFDPQLSNDQPKYKSKQLKDRKYSTSNFNLMYDKQNDSKGINQKLEQEKNSSINKIQEYYVQRNEALEEKIKDLKEVKEKIIRDQKILLRNNEELEQEITVKRNNNEESNRTAQLKKQIEKFRKKNSLLENENKQIISRKKELEKVIKETLKGHKLHLGSQIQARPKSISNVRCKYH